MISYGNRRIVIDKEKIGGIYTELYMAKGWKDRRSREKKIREVCSAISKYAMTLPPEVLGLFDTKVAPAALNSQFAGDDIGPCITVLEEKIKELEDKKDK